jgi:hypothetical protein
LCCLSELRCILTGVGAKGRAYQGRRSLSRQAKMMIDLENRRGSDVTVGSNPTASAR